MPRTKPLCSSLSGNKHFQIKKKLIDSECKVWRGCRRLWVICESNQKATKQANEGKASKLKIQTCSRRRKDSLCKTTRNTTSLYSDCLICSISAWEYGIIYDVWLWLWRLAMNLVYLLGFCWDRVVSNTFYFWQGKKQQLQNSYYSVKNTGPKWNDTLRWSAA